MEPCDEAVGDVMYSVFETASGREILCGRNLVLSGGIEIDEHLTAENLVFFRKRIRLSGSFQFAIDEHPDARAEDLKGFALLAINDEVQTTSWEWFNVVSPTEAAKLQEQGRLAIGIGRTGCGFEVVRTEFLTDVSLRLTRFFGDPTLEPYWRTTIRAGSWIAWPAGKAALE